MASKSKTGSIKANSRIKSKAERLKVIRAIILENSISNQEELLNNLMKEGFNVTQATLSRDIKLLKIVKFPDIYGNYIYVIPEAGYDTSYSETENHNTTFRKAISIEFSGVLAVIKTRPGYAMSVASDIDNLSSLVILGTIAGDDTILIIPREGFSRKEIMNVLTELIPELK